MQTPTSGATASATQTEEAVFTANRTTRRTNKPKPERQPLFKPAQTLSELFATARETAFNQSQYLGDLFNADDFTVFFGTSNSGKSILAYQLAEAIATGKNFFDVCSIGNREKDGYKLNNLNPEQVVLIADFETSENKLTRRYSNEAREQYEFSEI
jgi:RecA-family ATPase